MNRIVNVTMPPMIARGQHRAVAIPDLIVAAVAEIEGLTVLHHDGDFDLIAAITGQPVEWIVPPPAQPAGSASYLA